MKRIIITGLIVLSLSGGVALASDISDADYIATVRVTNNSTVASYVAVPITGINTTNLINQGFLNSSANNSVIRSSAGADIPFMPGYNAAWVTYVDSIAADSIIDYTWYNNSTGGEIRYFPDTSGMSVNDAASLELGSMFSVNASGYFTAGNVTASMSPATAQLTVTGAGDATALTPSAGSNYQCVDETYGSPNDTDYVYTMNDTVLIDYYEIQDGSIPAGAVIDSVTVYFRTKWSDEANYARPYLRLSGTNTAGTEITNSSSWTTNSEALSRPGGGTWSVSDIADLQVGIGLRAPNGMAECSQISVVIAYHIGAETSITAGEHDLIVASDGTDLTITIDEVEEASVSTGGASITNNSNTWYFAKSGYVCDKSGAFSITGDMLYVEYISVDVSGTPVSAWEWQYGDTFEDSIGSNDATPTFRTTSTDADVSAEFLDFRLASPAIAPAYSVSAAPDFITGNTTASSNFSSGNATASTSRPGDALIADAADAAGVPNVWLWGILGIVTIALSGLLISYMEKKYGSGNGTMFLRFGIAIAIMGIFVTFGIFDFWMIVIYCIIAISLLMASKQYDFNMSVTQLNLIGFLAMTWVGLTMINQIQEGYLITSAETAHLNNLMFTQEFTLLDTFHLPILNFEFFSVGIPSLLQWDYSFFGGNAQIIQYFLYSLTAVVSLIVLLIIIGTVSSYFVRST